MNSRILLYGNCQVQPLAAIIRELMPSVALHVLPPNFMLIDGSSVLLDDDKKFIGALDDNDLVLHQPLGEKHDSYSIHSIISSESSAKPACIRIPYIVFKAYFPDAYSPNPNSSPIECSSGLPSSPFGVFPYGHQWLDEIDVINTGIDSTSLSLITSHVEAKARQLDYRQSVEDTINTLRRKELDCDITISDFILDHYQAVRLFHTYNHPSIMVFLEVANRLFSQLDHTLPCLTAEKEASLAAAAFNDHQLPIFPFVAETLGLGFDCSDVKWKPFGLITIENYIANYLQHCFGKKIDPTSSLGVFDKISQIKERLRLPFAR